MGYFWGCGRVWKLFWGLTCSWTTFIFYVSFNSEIWFWLTFGGHFFIFGGPHGLFLGFGVGLKNCFEVYLYSWTILSMYVSVNSDICFCLILGYFLTFWGPHGLFLGFAVGFKNCFGVYSYSWTILILYVSVNSDICFCLVLG